MLHYHASQLTVNEQKLKSIWTRRNRIKNSLYTTTVPATVAATDCHCCCYSFSSLLRQLMRKSVLSRMRKLLKFHNRIDIWYYHVFSIHIHVYYDFIFDVYRATKSRNNNHRSKTWIFYYMMCFPTAWKWEGAINVLWILQNVTITLQDSHNSLKHF